MGLAGKLEALPLGEILQIICLSRKTGKLFLTGPAGEGSIFFQDGQVFGVDVKGRPSLDELLVARGLLDQETLAAAHDFLQTSTGNERFDQILTTRFGLQRDRLEELVRAQIMESVFELLTWNSGDFEFRFQENGVLPEPGECFPLLRQGLNTNYLVLEGKRRTGTGSSPDVEGGGGDTEPSGHLAGESPVVVLVDDHSASLYVLTRAVSRLGFPVMSAAGVREGIGKIDELARAGKRFVALIDLIMPKIDGSGMLGGLELFERLRAGGKAQVIIMSDHRHEEAEQYLIGLGIPFLMKPRADELSDNSILERFVDAIGNNLRHLNP